MVGGPHRQAIFNRRNTNTVLGWLNHLRIVNSYQSCILLPELSSKTVGSPLISESNRTVLTNPRSSAPSVQQIHLSVYWPAIPTPTGCNTNHHLQSCSGLSCPQYPSHAIIIPRCCRPTAAGSAESNSSAAQNRRDHPHPARSPWSGTGYWPIARTTQIVE